jgi:hypothetical protein
MPVAQRRHAVDQLVEGPRKVQDEVIVAERLVLDQL